MWQEPAIIAIGITKNATLREGQKSKFIRSIDVRTKFSRKKNAYEFFYVLRPYQTQITQIIFSHNGL